MYVYMCICVCMYVCMYVCMHGCMYIYICIYVCTYDSVYDSLHACLDLILYVIRSDSAGSDDVRGCAAHPFVGTGSGGEGTMRIDHWWRVCYGKWRDIPKKWSFRAGKSSNYMVDAWKMTHCIDAFIYCRLVFATIMLNYVKLRSKGKANQVVTSVKDVIWWIKGHCLVLTHRYSMSRNVLESG